MLDERTLAYPEFRGNGVMSSMGNIAENPHVGLMFIDFGKDRIGLHVNGSARIVEHAEFVRLMEDRAAADAVLGDAMLTRLIGKDGRQPRALGDCLGRRGLHALLQAHSADAEG